MIRKVLIGFIVGVLFSIISYGQFTDCSTGLLQAPTAEMQQDGTFMITNNVLNQHSLPSGGWVYTTFQYGINITFLSRLEIGYVCTIFNDHWSPSPPDRDFYVVNQDRHFIGRLCLLREGEFGLKWMPSVVMGVSDPTTGDLTGDYGRGIDNVAGSNNGYFNRYFIAFTKHFNTPWGQLGTHAGYQFNRRTDYQIKGLCAGVNWKPVWLQQRGFLDWTSIIAEYDSRTFNLGVIASLCKNRLEAMIELQNFRWINFGVRFKIRLIS